MKILKNKLVKTDEKMAGRVGYLCLVFAVIGVFAAGSLLFAGDTGPETVSGIRITEESWDSPGGVSGKQGDEDRADADTGQEMADPADIDDAAGADRIYVYVCGEVAAPGVYELEAGARAFEALAAAGGMTEGALEGAVNLAALLSDAQKLYIPSREEAETFAGVTGSAAEDPAADGSRKIDINTASASELTSLPGIGEKRAADIIAYRNGNGGFSSIEQLKQVKGIGEAVYAGLADRICVSGK